MTTTPPPGAPPASAPPMPDLGETLEINVDRMTLGDLEFVEEHTGWRADQLADLGADVAPPMAVTLALVAVTIRQKTPGLTYAQALEHARSLPVTFAIGSAEPSPTNADGSSS